MLPSNRTQCSEGFRKTFYRKTEKHKPLRCFLTLTLTETFKNIFPYRTTLVAASEIKTICRNTNLRVEIQLKTIYKLTVMTLQKHHFSTIN